MLNVYDVSLTLNQKLIIRDINLSVTSGDFIALIGPNGSGKSSLLRLLSAISIPNHGVIHLDGKEFSDYSAKERARYVSFFPQNRPLPNMDVWTLVAHGRFPHLAFGSKLRKSDEEIIQYAINKTQLTRVVNQPVKTLSGGERQRAYLAMMIAQDASILLIDEPANFLDIIHQIEMYDLMKNLNSSGKTIIFASHDLPAALTFSNHLVVIKDGSIIYNGERNDLLNTPILKQTFGVNLYKNHDASLYEYSIKKPD